MCIKRSREEDAEAVSDNSSLPPNKKLRAWPPAKPFGKNLPDHSAERGSVQQKRLYFGTWAEEDTIGTKRRLLNNGQTSLVAVSTQHHLQSFREPVYAVLSHWPKGYDLDDFVFRMHSWRQYFSHRTPTNRATAPLTPPSQEIPLPTPPVKPSEPAVLGQPKVPSAGHSSLSDSVSFDEIGKVAQKVDGSHGNEEENGENEDENTDDDDADEDVETDTDDDEDEDNENDEVFILTEAP
ncbi:hypothetical protein HDU80_008248, partial [Chytriomyces hyalinus]